VAGESIVKRFVAVAVPETQDFNDAFCFVHEVENAIGAFEDG